ncbi:MAG: copper amine oxidase [Selenomonadaceae bacterium]|nr:copper amine oxidase [Selenomonadaceae bacterium]
MFVNLSEARSSDSNVMHKLEVKSKDEGGTLLFSDSPEYVKDNGILYSDTVKGNVRILFFHLNDSNIDKRIAVIAENLVDKLNVIDITRGVVSEPDSNFLKVGKATQSGYLQKDFNYSLYLQKGESDFLIDEINNKLIKPGQLMYGVYDFHTANEVKVSVIMYPEGTDPFEFIKTAKVLPKDEHKLRGTFRNMNRVISLKKTYDPDVDGMVYIMLADDVNDVFKMGIDATDGRKAKDFGNYGIAYTINMKIKKGKKARIGLTPLGGNYAGAMRVHYKGETKLLLVPNGKPYFGDKTPKEPESVKKLREEGMSMVTDYTELSDLGIYSDEVRFEFSPPGASYLPVYIVLMPDND